MRGEAAVEATGRREPGGKLAAERERKGSGREDERSVRRGTGHCGELLPAGAGTDHATRKIGATTGTADDALGPGNRALRRLGKRRL